MSCGPIPFEPTTYDRELNLPKNPFSSNAFRTSSRSRKRRPKSPSLPDYSIIVHCHLCWDWVWQRPQQFVSRLSQRHPVLFVEMAAPDPELVAPLARFRKQPDFPNLTLLQLQFPAWRWSNGTYVDAERRRLVQTFLAGPAAGEFENPVQWFYDPMAVTAFAGQLNERLIVYDCMDELSRFRGAPPELLEREAELLARSDVVFTGGRKLFEAKRQLNDNCHFYGCGVDGAHFGRALRPETELPPELAALPKPVVGYFGVVDERIDYELITMLAEAQPDWSVVMIGPATKVDPRTLPRRANIHWLGKRDYADLPAMAKGFDLCFMPFACNGTTEFINPTKALEYMATGRPIVSTAIPDVISNFGTIIQIARSRQEFVSLCRQSLERPDAEAVKRGLNMVADHSWETIVSRLEAHVAEALAKNTAGREA